MAEQWSIHSLCTLIPNANFLIQLTYNLCVGLGVSREGQGERKTEEEDIGRVFV